MPKFIVRGEYTQRWEKEVEAKTRHDAWEKAYESWSDDDVFDTDTNIYDIEELKE